MIMVYWTQPEIFYREERRLRPGVRGKRNRMRDGVESAAEEGRPWLARVDPVRVKSLGV